METLIPEVIPPKKYGPPGRPRGDNYEKNQKNRRPKGKPVDPNLPSLADGRKWGHNIILGDKSKEHPIQVEAFEYFFNLENRNIRLVAEHFNISYNTMKKWSLKWDWSGRIDKRTKQDNSQRMIEPLTDTIKTKKDFLAVFRKILDKHVERNEEGQITDVVGIKINNVNDVKILLSAFREVFNDETFQTNKKGDSPLNHQINFIIKR